RFANSLPRWGRLGVESFAHLSFSLDFQQPTDGPNRSQANAAGPYKVAENRNRTKDINMAKYR
ncbi:MAG: hypothetical protein IJW40_06285, partial [Clostridia bacterium]|nr:hypothetical protein [Clostridia bacterium]